MELAPVLVKCVICRHPLVEQINKRIREHSIADAIRWMEGADLPVPHRNTFSTHKNEHMMDEYERARQQAARKLAESRKQIKGKAGDLAALVRDNVYQRVEDGDLEPTLAEGLRAQQMLDARAQAQGDRDLMLQLAGLLSGATPPVALLSDGNTVEGEFEDVTERAADEAEFTALLTG